MSFNFETPPPPPTSTQPEEPIMNMISGGAQLPPFVQEMLCNIGANFIQQQQQPLPPQPSLLQPSFNPYLQGNQMLNPEILRQFLIMMNLNNQLVANLTSSNNSGSSATQATTSVGDERQSKMRRDREMKKSVSMESNDEMMSMSFDNNGDIIVPSNDKEGWCRNKKYIEKTETGFMCTVCRKVYGRYNSVSYHVTIYHRNPPIKCNLNNCQFTTREARYIHFHKYYRHGVPLPQNIDQGSRKCPHCRHVSKSPAMLEKHIRRHQLKEDTSEGSDVLDALPRDRTVTISEEPMEMEMEEYDEQIETKPRSCTM